MKVLAKPIEMLAWFTCEGLPNPIRFKIISEDNAFTVIKIDRVITKELEKLAGNNMVVFKCQSNINGTEKLYEIKYDLRTCKWILFKI